MDAYEGVSKLQKGGFAYHVEVVTAYKIISVSVFFLSVLQYKVCPENIDPCNVSVERVNCT